jgi:membrane dipeptidase
MIFDAHCDVLYKLHVDRSRSFDDSTYLHTTSSFLSEIGARVQCFALFVNPSIKPSQRFQTVLEMINLFHSKVIESSPFIKLIKNRQDISNLKKDEIGAVLTLEGIEGIEEDFEKFSILYHLGVRSVGLTWNAANAAADGALEPRKGGLTLFGKKIVRQLNEKGLWVDVSHLSEQAFWDVMEHAYYPVATHSNIFELCRHPRNLKNEQIKALVAKNGVIGITFVPNFLSPDGNAGILDVLRHLERACELGDEDHVGFGSDFDGISETPKGLNDFRGYHRLRNELEKKYSASQVEKFLYKNFASRFPS